MNTHKTFWVTLTLKNKKIFQITNKVKDFLRINSKSKKEKSIAIYQPSRPHTGE
jgi:hypothetical protein